MLAEVALGVASPGETRRLLRKHAIVIGKHGAVSYILPLIIRPMRCDAMRCDPGSCRVLLAGPTLAA